MLTEVYVQIGRSSAFTSVHPSLLLIFIAHSQFGLSDLKILCLTEIYAQLKPQNIVPELFSEFTSRYGNVRILVFFLREINALYVYRYPPIRDYELTYICNNSYDPIIADTLPAWIEAVTNGSLSHSTNVMTLLLPMLLRK